VPSPVPCQKVPARVANQKGVAPIPDEKVSARVPDQKTSTPVPDQKVLARVAHQKVSVPVPEQKVAAPIPDEKVSARDPDLKTSTPVPNQEVPAQVVGQKVSAPVPDQKVAAPVPDEEVSARVPAQKVSTPVPERKVPAQVAQQKVSATVPSQKISAPVPDPLVPAPVPDERAFELVPDFPPPPAARQGWPWQKVTRVFSPSQQKRSALPRITIVTPSYNQGQFLEETIRSVLLQGYPNLEYIVIDGGSNDNSIDIIRTYEPWLTYWISEKDKGQSHAINKGWRRATGDLISYLNSDDTLLPGALFKVAKAWQQYPQAVAVVGGTCCTDLRSENVLGTVTPKLPGSAPLDLTLLDHETWLLPQQSGFWSRVALDKVGRWVREDLHYTMDRELYYRLCVQGKLTLITDSLATYRFHDTSKSMSAILAMYREDPKALTYCDWGGPEAQKRRKKVGKWRVGQGHFKFGRACESKARKLQHLLLAALYRPGYLRRKRFWNAALEALGLRRPLGRVRQALLTRIV
jgi:glycosyltransferase involved in cell wall biosynthesis